MREEPLSWWEQAPEPGVPQGRAPYTGPATSGQLTALQELEYLAAGQEQAYRPVGSTPHVAHPAPALEKVVPPGTGERAPGRHHASQSRGDEILRQHGDKFFSFSAIGGGIFVVGLVLQAALTSVLHVPSLISYVVQAVVSVEASYFLNRWFTWKGVKTPFWGSFLRYNLQKVVTVTLNLVAYGVLLKLGVQYLLDNILLTVIFTFVNYIGADKLVFLRGGKQMVAAVTGPLPVLTGPMPALRLARHPEPRRQPIWRELPSISVVIPVRSNEETIGAAVESILAQDYPMLRELVLVGSPGDSTWRGLRGIDDPRLFVMETETPPGIRDANFKRDLGIRETSGDLVSLIDSDMVIPRDWMSNAVRLLMENEVDCVAGVMRSIHDDFWGRFVDKNRLGAKTPRAASSYMVTADGFGAGGYKPPITADILFTRAMYEDVPIDGNWSHGSLEDYEWFWRVVEKGHRVLVSSRLFGWHHHRSGFKKLAGEYRRSARGCAYFIRAHRESPFAQKRMTQAVVLPLAALVVISGLAAVAALGHGMQAVTATLALGAAGLLLLCVREFIRTRSLESLVYPVPALILGVNYTASLATHLIRNAPMYGMTAVTNRTQQVSADIPSSRAAGFRLLHPLTVILAVQGLLSLSLIWSNTVFGDEADYLWLGRLLVAHWLHGATWPSQYGDTVLSGSPYIYPPLGAVADAFGGLAGARALSLIFMLGATVLIYSVASRLFGELVAIFSTAIWAACEPTLKLAFATYDALSISLTALSAWLIIQVSLRKHRGEFIVLAAVALGLSNSTAYSGVVIDPVVLSFAFLVWKDRIGIREAWMFSSWMTVGTVLSFSIVMTAGHSWSGIMYTVFARNLPDQQTMLLILNDVWAYSGFVAVLAIAGIALAFGSRQTNARPIGLLVLLGLSVFVVPLAQFHEQTAWSMDKHLAYGIWFGAMAAGYAVASSVRLFLNKRNRVAALVACAIAFTYPAIGAWQSAWLNFHGWPNSTTFIAALKPVLAESHGHIYAAGAVHIAEYYTPQGRQWERWTSSGFPLLSKNGVSLATWRNDLRASSYGVFTLFYPTSFSAPKISAGMLLSADSSMTSHALLQLAGENASEPGLPGLTEALEDDHSYKLVSVGPYDSRSVTQIYAIWVKA